MRYSSISSVCLVLAILATLSHGVVRAEEEAANIATNGSFEENIDGWTGLIVDRQNDNERVPRPDFVAHATEGLQEGSQGALQITFEDLGYDTLASHRSGVHTLLTESAPEGSRLHIQFDAKSLAGSPYISVRRAWGGSTPDRTVELTEAWETHELYLTLDFSTAHLVWTIVGSTEGSARNRLAIGRVLIDNVRVTILED